MPNSGPIALVTGAGRGIGRATAIRLSQEGHPVALVSRTQAELEVTARSCPSDVLVLPADLTSVGAVEDVFGSIEATWGPVNGQSEIPVGGQLMSLSADR